MKSNWYRLIIIVIIMLIIGLIVLIVLYNPGSKRIQTQESTNQAVSKENSPPFRKDGVVSFLRKGSTQKICSIDIEVADNEASRTQGLMFRDSLPKMAGMLFMFEEQQPLSFWMKNTKIPLDIMFIDSTYQVINIARHTVPYSEAQVLSDRPAKYVVEVNGGFSKKYGIEAGDRIAF